MVKVYIEKSPLHVIIRSCLEPRYNRETIGNLYGEIQDKKSGKNYIVENAQSHQEAELKPSNTYFDSHSESALEWGIENIIGVYHSHTKYPTKNGFRYPILSLSDIDLKEMIKNHEQIWVLLTIKKTNRKWPLKQYNDEIYGTVLFKDAHHLIHIRPYYLIGKSKRIAEIKIQKRLLKKLFE